MVYDACGRSLPDVTWLFHICLSDLRTAYGTACDVRQAKMWRHAQMLLDDMYMTHPARASLLTLWWGVPKVMTNEAWQPKIPLLPGYITTTRQKYGGQHLKFVRRANEPCHSVHVKYYLTKNCLFPISLGRRRYLRQVPPSPPLLDIN